MAQSANRSISHPPISRARTSHLRTARAELTPMPARIPGIGGSCIGAHRPLPQPPLAGAGVARRAAAAGSCAAPRLGWCRRCTISLSRGSISRTCRAGTRIMSPKRSRRCATPVRLRPMARRSAGRHPHHGRSDDRRPGGGLAAACGALTFVKPGDDIGAAAFLEANFQPFAALDSTTDQGLFTGYYETELDGAGNPIRASPSRSTAPRRSRDLHPGRDRRRGAEGQGAGILWLRDPVDNFMLQIQAPVWCGCPTASSPGSAMPAITGRISCRGKADDPGRHNSEARVRCRRSATGCGRIRRKPRPGCRRIRATSSSANWPGTPHPHRTDRRIGRHADAGAQHGGRPGFLPLGAPIWLDTHAPDGSPLQR